MANPSPTYVHAGRGFYNWSTNQVRAIDYDYRNYVEQDDPGNFLSSYLMVHPDSAEVASGREFYAWGGALSPRNTTLAATVAFGSSDTTGTITVASTDGMRKYDVLWMPTSNAIGTQLRITAFNGTTLSCQRIAPASGTAITDANGNAVYIIAEATDELEATSAEDSYVAPARVTNRIQTLRRAWALSLTEMATSTRLGVSFAQYKADQARQDFTKDVAHVFWFSTSNVVGTTVTTSNGINEQLVGNSSSYKLNVNGNLSINDYTDIMAALVPFAKTREYFCFHGEAALAGFADLGTTATIQNLKPGDSKYGFVGRAVAVADFRFDQVYERVLSEVGDPFNAYLFFIDPGSVKNYHLRGLKFKYAANIHADPGGQIRKSQYESHIGLGLTWPKTCAYAYGIAHT